MTPQTVKAVVIAIFVFVIGCTKTDQQAGQEERVIAQPVDLAATGPLQSKDDSKLNVSPESSAPGRLRESPGKAKREAVLARQIAPGVSPLRKSAVKGPALPAAEGVYRLDSIRMAAGPVDRENYAHFDDNAIRRVLEHPVSTFSIDVDTGAYANVRRMLSAGQLPAQDAVRAEELINYFSYEYPVSADKSVPFSLHKEMAPTPWNPDTYLLHIGIKGYELPQEQLPPANLVFLIDVSGSMQSANKLKLLKTSLKLLTRHLGRDDSVSIVVYAGASGVVLEPTPGTQRGRIIAALDRLTAGGSTNGAAGIRLAYAMAEQGFIKGGINRVLLATDGDFNVGTVSIEQLKDLVEEKRKSGIALSTLGFGAGNYNDQLMEQIADVGNGNYAYIDTLQEAQKVLVDEMSSTMLTIARDVKIQIEFNPAVVAEYRLIGYENRSLKREDFNNDNVDAGEIGAGHSVTALYEIALNGGKGRRIEPLRYRSTEQKASHGNEIGYLRLRYKMPDGNTSRLLEWPLRKSDITAAGLKTSNAFRFSAAVAAFAQKLRGGVYTDPFDYTDIMKLARSGRGDDPFGYRGEFLHLVNMAQSLSQTEEYAQRTD
ncbi:MAG: von Willebrand factor type A domain-containing protein [Gammaproteobacteria bacterium]